MVKFIAVSLTAHLGALAALATPFVPRIVVPAPEMSVALAAAPAAPLAPRAATPARQPPAPAMPPAERTPTTADASSALTEPAREPAATVDARRSNHLRTLLYQALDQYFTYPAVARRNGWEGKVDVAFKLDEYGRLEQLRVVHSSGYAVLDQDAVLTLQRIGAIPQARGWLEGGSYNAELPVVYKLIVD